MTPSKQQPKAGEQKHAADCMQCSVRYLLSPLCGVLKGVGAGINLIM